MTDSHPQNHLDPLAWVAGSDAPEKSAINLGFMALTDSASLIVAATQGFAQPYGLTLNLQRQASWATLRDKLLSGELDAAQGLYGLLYAVHLGIGGTPPVDMAVLMGLSQNGQSINLSRPLQTAGAEAIDTPGLEVSDHLRWRHDHAVDVFQWMDALAGQPVIEPHGMGAGGEGLGEGQFCTALAHALAQCFSAGHASSLQWA